MGHKLALFTNALHIRHKTCGDNSAELSIEYKNGKITIHVSHSTQGRHETKSFFYEEIGRMKGEEAVIFAANKAFDELHSPAEELKLNI